MQVHADTHTLSFSPLSNSLSRSCSQLCLPRTAMNVASTQTKSLPDVTKSIKISLVESSATLCERLSVRPSVGWSVGRSVTLSFFGLLGAIYAVYSALFLGSGPSLPAGSRVIPAISEALSAGSRALPAPRPPPALLCGGTIGHRPLRGRCPLSTKVTR